MIDFILLLWGCGNWLLAEDAFKTKHISKMRFFSVCLKNSSQVDNYASQHCDPWITWWIHYTSLSLVGIAMEHSCSNIRIEQFEIWILRYYLKPLPILSFGWWNSNIFFYKQRKCSFSFLNFYYLNPNQWWLPWKVLD